MDREIVLTTLACVLCGPALVVAGALTLRLRPPGAAREHERAAWRRLWFPVVPAALILAFLIGWALQEPEAAEPADAPVLAFAAVFAFIALRAVVRAARAFRAPAHPPVAMTTGLLRPRVVVAPELAARLDGRALDAALAHEQAHVRHRDPLRLWLAQLATDLQWPVPGARQRFSDWRHALELARDAEACERVDGSDLAAALIEAARLTRAPAGEVHACLVADPDGAAAFSDRIYRLLDGATAVEEPGPRRWASWAPVAVAICLAVVAGAHYGERIIGLLPGLDG